MQRVEIHLTKEENREFHRLRPEVGVAFAFWKRIGEDRGLDHKTILLEESGLVSGLPKGHNKHWCWPYPLICQESPEKQLKYLKNIDG